MSLFCSVKSVGVVTIEVGDIDKTLWIYVI